MFEMVKRVFLILLGCALAGGMALPQNPPAPAPKPAPAPPAPATPAPPPKVNPTSPTPAPAPITVRGSPRFEATRVAAEKGEATAQFNLGMMFAAGQEVAQDVTWAAEWLRRAAEQGTAGAQYNLAVF